MKDIEIARQTMKAATKAHKRPVYRRALELLSRRANRLPIVNVGKLDKLADDGGIILVPGKVLGGGTVTKRLHVGALSFTSSASLKITQAGGRALSLKDFVDEFGDTKGVLLVGG